MEEILFAYFLILYNRFNSALEVYVLVINVFKTQTVFSNGILLTLHHTVTAFNFT